MRQLRLAYARRYANNRRYAAYIRKTPNTIVPTRTTAAMTVSTTS